MNHARRLARRLVRPPPPGRTRAPWLRRTFELPAPPRRAVLHVASIGYHEVHVNGAKVGDALLEVLDQHRGALLVAAHHCAEVGDVSHQDRR